MALIDSAVDGLFGAVATGMFGGLALWWSRRRGTAQLEDAWKKQADELADRLAAQFQAEINWLRKQLGTCQGECARLNKIITRRHTGGTGD